MLLSARVLCCFQDKIHLNPVYISGFTGCAYTLSEQHAKHKASCPQILNCQWQAAPPMASTLGSPHEACFCTLRLYQVQSLGPAY